MSSSQIIIIYEHVGETQTSRSSPEVSRVMYANVNANPYRCLNKIYYYRAVINHKKTNLT